MDTVFLTAEWRKLIIANYIVDPACLAAYLPAKTEIDLWQNSCFISLVGFHFMNTRIKNYSFPFHRNFEEVNLRFYVRYKEKEKWKRGVVFIKEFVPLPMVTFIANNLYDERYQTIPMSHHWQVTPAMLNISYSWKARKAWHKIRVSAPNTAALIAEGSEQEFITQHFWGYSKKRRFTSEYQVEHPLWQAYPVSEYEIQVDYGKCYGRSFEALDHSQPCSVYLVEGSPVRIFKDRKIY